jgi:PLP dependent protein
VETLEQRYQRVLARVPSDVVLISVSKGQSVDSVEALYRLGHRDFGENYVLEMVEKAEEMRRRGCVELRWHFIGHLQTNKVKALLPHVFCVHSVDSLKLARELSKRWEGTERLPVFLQVNQDAEESKSGFSADEVSAAAAEVAALPGLELVGLMSIPEPGGDTREKFASLRDSAASCGLKKLSMGMSGDFELAIAEGSTHVRVGTSIFGPRRSSFEG